MLNCSVPKSYLVVVLEVANEAERGATNRKVRTALLVVVIHHMYRYKLTDIRSTGKYTEFAQ
jgi:hypothetical protein